MKKCRGHCAQDRPLSDFYKHSGMLDGHLNICKECKKDYERENKHYEIYDRTEKGVLRTIYKTQRSNSKRRNHVPPSFTKKELVEWAYKNGFRELYLVWAESGYEKRLKPSVDRLKDELPYAMDNIRLVTWEINKAKQTADMILGRSTSGARCKPVIQYDLDGKEVNEFISFSEATKVTGISNIDAVCKGVRKTAGGFKFKYKENANDIK